ncbi:DUF5708 family protein [Paractinoplanes atraurantiacus]|uniref:Uncharacterized protein n=1 Tax=Paractinoplanes atraurantiacus TaxID=1036182 RepID=A0A285IBB2_9ACTN|nr:DUF5708 family protein [Actinoplanes atraurantiacus]SNY45269.1 hypothetical protein SAMN05421748_107199 [Actinoplanes atraurantiacus]
MRSPVKIMLAGAATFVVGLLSWLFTGDVETPVFNLQKVGVVLMVIGGLEFLWGLYQAARAPARPDD